MKARRLIGVAALVVSAGMYRPLVACGDKYLNLALGTTYERSPAERKAAAVLLYANAGTELSRLVTALEVDAGMRKQGYQPTIVSNVSELETALRVRQWQVVVLDGRDTDAVGRRLPKPGGPQLVPVMIKPTKDALKEARKIYQTVLDTPTRNRVFVDVVDDALDLHELEARAAAKAAKKAAR